MSYHTISDGEDKPVAVAEGVLDLLVSIHHQLATDSDLDTVTAPEKYRALRMRIEGVLAHTPYAYLCTGGPQE